MSPESLWLHIRGLQVKRVKLGLVEYEILVALAVNRK